MPKLFIATLCYALLVTAVDARPLDRQEYEQVEKTTREICQDGVRHGCWQPLEKLLQRLPRPIDKWQWDEYFFGHLALSQAAYWAGDVDVSSHFFEDTLEIAKRIDQFDEGRQGFAVLLITSEAAAPALSLGNYKRALAYLDLALAQPASQGVYERIAVMRAGALVGLHRDAEARKTLDLVVATLHLDGQAPWEGFPFVSGPINPYETVRRAAAFYSRQGDAAASLALLERAEATRRATIESMPKEPVPGGYWAQQLQPGILQLDMASVHEQQGHQEEAEQLKRAAAAMDKASTKSNHTDTSGPDPLAKVLSLLN
jgi:tetratricopeptide (TPR) repeat protein